MASSMRSRRINPRLGIYFGIFASLFVAIVLVVLIFEQLGAPETTTRLAMMLGPALLIMAIGVASNTSDPIEYFAAGRRVPAVYCGLGLALSALGATGIACLGGAIFFVGFDAFCIVNAGLLGFVAMAILLAPFFRKFGTFTIPTYLGRRFGSHVLRVAAAAFLAVPTLLFLVAELQIGLKTAQWLTGLPVPVVVGLLVAFVVGSLALGGMRSLIWTNVAAAIAVILAVTVPLATVAILLGYLPLAQLSHGPVLRGLEKLEALQAIPVAVQSGLQFGLPDDGFHTMAKRFSEPFGAVSPTAFVLATFSIFAGFASAPWLLPRVATASGVYESRKTLGWATFFFGLIMLTVATITVFARHIILQMLNTNIATPPAWLQTMMNLGLADVPLSGARLTEEAVALDRDGVLISLPIAAGLPMAFAYLTAAGIIVASIAAAMATVSALSTLMSEDIASGLTWKPAKDQTRRITNQVLMVSALAFAGAVVVVAPTDPLKLMLWSLALTGATAFPVLIASVWWKRANKFGAFAGMVTGFAISILVIVAGEAGWTGVDGALAGVIALPMAAIAMVVVSLATFEPSRELLELLRDIRIPGGEIVYDREIRLIKLKDRTRAKPTTAA